MDNIFKKIYEEDRRRSEEQEYDGEIIKVMFLKRNPLLVNELFPLLEVKLKSEIFKHDFLKRFLERKEAERGGVILEIQRCESFGRNSSFYTCRLPRLDRELAIDSVEGYLDLLQDPNHGHPGIIEVLINNYFYLNGKEASDPIFISEQYHLYQIGTFFYELYSLKSSLFMKFEQPAKARLCDIYQKRGVDLVASDLQFSKYGLLTLKDGIKIVNNKECQTLVDSEVGLYYWIDVPRSLLLAIEAAMGEGFVKDVAFNVEGVTDVVPSMEDLEFGSLFSFDALNLPSLSKLFESDSYEDNFWVSVNKNKQSITFEEVCADFAELDERVITRLVHLEFKELAGEWVISHIDHEYILYTLDEYVERGTNPKQKGHAKIKTFKIDNAKIPFDYRYQGRLFLYLVLDAYFVNKGLVREYFSTVQSD